MKTLLNKAAAREYALEQSRLQRNGRFTRVSKSFVDGLDAVLRTVIAERVRRHPGIGKTLKGD